MGIFGSGSFRPLIWQFSATYLAVFVHFSGSFLPLVTLGSGSFLPVVTFIIQDHDPEMLSHLLDLDLSILLEYLQPFPDSVSIDPGDLGERTDRSDQLSLLKFSEVVISGHHQQMDPESERERLADVFPVLDLSVNLQIPAHTFLLFYASEWQIIFWDRFRSFWSRV